jgi:hypothetical protein
MIDARSRRFARHVPERRTGLTRTVLPLHFTRRDKRSASLRGDLAAEFEYVLWTFPLVDREERDAALRVFATEAR